jgi:hypothetical protein
MNVSFQIAPDGRQIIYTDITTECPRCESIIIVGDQVRIDHNGALHCGARWVCDMRQQGLGF